MAQVDKQIDMVEEGTGQQMEFTTKEMLLIYHAIYEAKTHALNYLKGLHKTTATFDGYIRAAERAKALEDIRFRISTTIWPASDDEVNDD